VVSNFTVIILVQASFSILNGNSFFILFIKKFPLVN